MIRSRGVRLQQVQRISGPARPHLTVASRRLTDDTFEDPTHAASQLRARANLRPQRILRIRPSLDDRFDLTAKSGRGQRFESIHAQCFLSRH